MKFRWTSTIIFEKEFSEDLDKDTIKELIRNNEVGPIHTLSIIDVEIDEDDIDIVEEGRT